MLLTCSIAVTQCVITIPDTGSGARLYQQQNLNMDPVSGDLEVSNRGSTSIVFDSFSSEGIVQRRNPISNSISRINDPSRHFPVSFNVMVEGSVSAVLSPSSVEQYCTPDRRIGGEAACVERPSAPCPGPALSASKRTLSNLYELDAENETRPVSEEPKSTLSRLSELDAEIEARKRQCLLLFGDLDTTERGEQSSIQPQLSLAGSDRSSPEAGSQQHQLPPPQLQQTFASALLQHVPRNTSQQLQIHPLTQNLPRQQQIQQKQTILPAMYTPFSDVRAQFAPSSSTPTPNSSYETVVVCTVQKQDLISLPSLHRQQLHGSTEEMIAISSLADLQSKRY